jgi:phage shock protein E
MKSILSFVALFVAFAVTSHAADPKNISIQDAAKLIKQDTNVVVLDVRTPKEFEAGHIKGATNINVFDKEFAQKIEALDKSKTYIVHCQSGGRSAKACDQIKPMKFKHVLHMNQGFGAWEQAGLPVEK